jgi:uncharacterized protein (DUF433 family)
VGGGGQLRSRKTTNRNRAILADHLAGKTSSQLARIYGLAPASITAIITFERHKLDVSIDGFYEQLRSALGIAFSPVDQQELQRQI